MARTSPRRRRRRLGRWFALGALVLIGFLYVNPVRSYLDTRSALEGRAKDVRVLERERRALERRLARSTTPEALVRQARRIGLVRPGERLFIVKGIDEWRKRQASRARSR